MTMTSASTTAPSSPGIDALQARLLPLIDAHASIDRPAASLGADDDLYTLGMSSHDSIQLMMALEADFSIEFPNALLTKASFQSIAAILRTLERAGAVAA